MTNELEAGPPDDVCVVGSGGKQAGLTPRGLRRELYSLLPRHRDQLQERLLDDDLLAPSRLPAPWRRSYHDQAAERRW